MMTVIKGTENDWRTHAVWGLLILFVTLAIHVCGSLWIGYVSDDYDLLQWAPTVPLFRPAQGHHFSPVVTGLFKLASSHNLSAVWWHALALNIHLINSLLVFAIVHSGLRQSKWPALTITAIFSFSAAGYEALAWACSIGYVLVLPCMLFAILGVLTVTTRRIGIMAVLLAILQASALLIWDWGILLLPLTSVTVLAWRVRQRDLRFGRVFLMLVPCAAMWCLLVVAKRALGYQSGYHAALDNLILGAKMVVAAPLTNLLPNATSAFLTSTYGAFLACTIWVLLGWSAIRSRIVMLAMLLYLVCLGPVALFGVLQARYTYIATPFLCIAAVCAASRLKSKHLASAICLFLVIGHAVFAFQRSQLWADAYRAASSLKHSIQSIQLATGKDLVVVNLPDSYGPPTLIWRPFVWRNGLSAFDRDFKRVNTQGSPLAWSASPIPSMPRENIAAAHPGCEIHEVVYLHPNDWRKFSLVSWQNDNTGTGGDQVLQAPQAP